MSVAASGLLLLGTDTGVGKTSVALALLHAGARVNRPWLPYKPAETGCDPDPLDAQALLEASGIMELSLAEVCPYPLGPPVAPLLASRLAGFTLTPDDLIARARALGRRGFPLLVETAGGLLTPYAPSFTGADLAIALGLPLVLVARNALGTINHTSLAYNELVRRGRPPASIILVDVDGRDTPDRPYNAQLVQEATGLAPLLLPFATGRNPAQLADALERSGALTPLLRLGGTVTG